MLLWAAVSFGSRSRERDQLELKNSSSAASDLHRTIAAGQLFCRQFDQRQARRLRRELGGLRAVAALRHVPQATGETEFGGAERRRPSQSKVRPVSDGIRALLRRVPPGR